MQAERHEVVTITLTVDEAESLLGMLADVDEDNWDTKDYVNILKKTLGLKKIP